MPRERYEIDQVKVLWRKFAFLMKEQGLETFYNAMIRREPIDIGNDNFQLIVDNQIQVDYIGSHLQEMNAFFRKNLQNYAFSIQLSITDKPEEEIKFLTGKDKFNALARKNPNLHTLKTMFNLDIEF
jgi:hypothetical protein